MTLNKRMQPAAMLALALMGLHPGSQAGTLTTQNGTDCKSYGWNSPADAYIDTTIDSTGVTNRTNGSINVVCPVTRVGPATSVLRVWIDGNAPFGSVVTCRLWSYNYNGLPLASQRFDLTSTGVPFDKYLELSAAYVPAYSSQVVVCTLPPGGYIYDVEPVSL